jgi:UDP-glucose 4-epimerase
MSAGAAHPAFPVSGRHVLVTGGAGFIGSHLVDGLLARGAGRVTILDSLKYANASHRGKPRDRVSVVRLTLGGEGGEDLAEAMADVDLVFHLAAEKHNQSQAEPRALLAANIAGSYDLYQAAGRAGVQKLVFASSLYAYGRVSGPPMREDDLPAPATVYGISKLAGEQLAAHARAKYGMPSLALRYFFVYGPRQFPGTGYKSVIVANFERLLRGEAPVILGDGKQTLDYVYVDDVVDATIRAMESPLDGEVVNVGSAQAVSIEDLTRMMIEVSGKSIAPVYGPADWTQGSARVGENRKIASLLGWTPQTPLREGLARTYRSLVDGFAGSADSAARP